MRAGVAELRLSRSAGVSGRQRLWQPAWSWGGVLGVMLCTGALSGVIGLAAAAVVTESVPTRLIAMFLEVPILLVFGTCLLGTWRWFTLTYALAPTALEIRYGTRRLRLRYEDMTRIALPEPNGNRPGTWLWPGVPAGDERVSGGHLARWWGTTQRPESRVLVETTSGVYLLTPTTPLAFSEALRGNLRGHVAPVAAPLPRGGWLELVANVDPWFRLLAVIALLVAAVGIAGEGLALGAATRHSTVAALGLLVNIVLGGVVVRQFPHAARVAMGATLALEFLGVLL